MEPANVQAAAAVRRWQMKAAAAARRWQEIHSAIQSECANTFSRVTKAINNIIVIAPLRERAERIYSATQTPNDLHDYSGSTVPLRLLEDQDGLRSSVNKWLSLLDIDYTVDVRMLDTTGYFQILFRDTRNHDAQPVNYADVGFGISQILPILVACLDKRPSTILIEQPELHIHPRLQAKLGSLFEEAINTFHHQVIVETHSEHLMLRIQKLMKAKKFTPTNVSVLYVSRGENGSSVQRLDMNEEGEFLDPWPMGFFPERLQEML
jgi:hypothetical protein